eukprot:TRINITY_DN14843_c0_g1_i1.p1 TRINITY_DN14843_c0_g1~~TRINITY_DN14843_c0_g1_i1.p1  ORF type:complete len:606 (-),score=153.42 TRINITY_DN14843_c0_g1_i1:403-2220(-)
MADDEQEAGKEPGTASEGAVATDSPTRKSRPGKALAVRFTSNVSFQGSEEREVSKPTSPPLPAASAGDEAQAAQPAAAAWEAPQQGDSAAGGSSADSPTPGLSSYAARRRSTASAVRINKHKHAAVQNAKALGGESVESWLSSPARKARGETGSSAASPTASEQSLQPSDGELKLRQQVARSRLGASMTISELQGAGLLCGDRLQAGVDADKPLSIWQLCELFAHDGFKASAPKDVRDSSVSDIGSTDSSPSRMSRTSRTSRASRASRKLPDSRQNSQSHLDDGDGISEESSETSSSTSSDVPSSEMRYEHSRRRAQLTTEPLQLGFVPMASNSVVSLSGSWPPASCGGIGSPYNPQVQLKTERRTLMRLKLQARGGAPNSCLQLLVLKAGKWDLRRVLYPQSDVLTHAHAKPRARVQDKDSSVAGGALQLTIDCELPPNTIVQLLLTHGPIQTEHDLNVEANFQPGGSNVHSGRSAAHDALEAAGRAATLAASKAAVAAAASAEIARGATFDLQLQFSAEVSAGPELLHHRHLPHIEGEEADGNEVGHVASKEEARDAEEHLPAEVFLTMSTDWRALTTQSGQGSTTNSGEALPRRSAGVARGR